MNTELNRLRYQKALLQRLVRAWRDALYGGQVELDALKHARDACERHGALDDGMHVEGRQAA